METKKVKLKSTTCTDLVTSAS